MSAPALAYEFSGDLQAARGGDRAAFARLIERYRNLISTLALTIVRDVHTSEDVAQEVFVATWQRLNELRNPASLLPWMRQITRNRAKDALERRRRLTPDEEAVHAAADPRNLTQQLERTEEEKILAECLEALGDDDREVVTLFYREGQSVRQVSELLDLSEDAVKKRLSRSRERLRESVLAKFADLAVATRPNEAFTRAVIAALPLSATPGFLGGGAGVAGALGKFAPLLGGAALGWTAGMFGIWSGVKGGLKGARDDQERRELIRSGMVSSAVSTLFVASALATLAFEAPKWVLIATWFVFASTMLAICTLWTPRIIARRQAAERAEDPGAAARQRKERRIALVSIITSQVMGATPIVLYALGIIGRR